MFDATVGVPQVAGKVRDDPVPIEGFAANANAGGVAALPVADAVPLEAVGLYPAGVVLPYVTAAT